MNTFDGLPLFHNAQQTSIDAAREIKPHRETLRERVLALLGAWPSGLTDEEMQNALSMNPSTQRPRRQELLKLGKIEDSGLRRKTASGRSAIIWRTLLQ